MTYISRKLNELQVGYTQTNLKTDTVVKMLKSKDKTLKIRKKKCITYKGTPIHYLASENMEAIRQPDNSKFSISQ